MASPVIRLRHLEYLTTIAAGLLLWTVSVRNIGRGTWEIAGIIGATGLIIWQFLKFSKAVRREASNFVQLRPEGGGTIRVHASVVEEALRHAARSLPEVHDVRVRLVIDPTTGLPSAGQVEARIKDITNIKTVHSALSRVLGDRYEQIIPSGPPIEFHLTIKYHFRPPSKPKKRREKSVPPEDDETKAIRAPQYPIPD